MVCKKCGALAADNAVFCTVCGTRFEKDANTEAEKVERVVRPALSEDVLMGEEPQTLDESVSAESVDSTQQSTVEPVSQPIPNPAPAFQQAPVQPAPIVYPVPEGERTVGGTLLAEDETAIRTYNCAKITISLFRPKLMGFLTVTNKRMLYEGYGQKNHLLMETPIDQVAGIRTYYNTAINIALLVIGSIVSILGIGFLPEARRMMVYFWWLVLIIGVILILLSLRRAYQLIVFSSASSNEAINIGTGPVGHVLNNASYTLSASPTPDTERMLREIGALIQDVQQMGDGAIEKWKL